MEKISKKLGTLFDEMVFFCPGCNRPHVINVYEARPHDGAIWQWNGNLEKPTFSPALKVGMPPLPLCHSVIRNGRIHFLKDSEHDLAGQEVELPDFPDGKHR